MGPDGGEGPRRSGSGQEFRAGTISRELFTRRGIFDRRCKPLRAVNVNLDRQEEESQVLILITIRLALHDLLNVFIHVYYSDSCTDILILGVRPIHGTLSE